MNNLLLDRLKTQLSSGLERAKQLFRKVTTYLNGNIDNRLFSHPAFRWGVLATVAVYVVLGLVVGWKVYKVRAESTNIRRILAIYPMPAVLMPQDVILVRDYLNQLRFIRHFTDKTKQTLPPDKELREQLLNQMLETRLLLQTNKRYGTRVSKADIDAAYKKIADENGGPGELQKLLADLYGMKEGEFRQLIRDQLLREKVRKEVLTQVQAKHILIKDEAKAKQILEQIKKEPAKFDELAKAHSEDTASRDKAGDLGFFGRGVKSPSFEEAAFKLKKDELTAEPVKTESGFHIIKVTDRKGRVDQSYRDFITELRKKKRIWVVYR